MCLIDRDAKDAEATPSMIHAAGGEALVCQGDITLPGDCARMVAAAVAGFGRLDILVNNVGISIGGGPLDARDGRLVPGPQRQNYGVPYC